MKTVMKVLHPAGIALSNRALLDAFIYLCLKIDHLGVLRDELSGIDELEITGEISGKTDTDWGVALNIWCRLKIEGVEPDIRNTFLSFGTFLYVKGSQAGTSHPGPRIVGRVDDVIAALAGSILERCLEKALMASQKPA